MRSYFYTQYHYLNKALFFIANGLDSKHLGALNGAYLFLPGILHIPP